MVINVTDVTQNNVLLWFRNDLRLDDNPAFDYLLAQQTVGVQAKAIFFVTYEQWRIFYWSQIKIDLLLRHVYLIKHQLEQINVPLDIIEVDDFKGQIDYLSEHCRQNINCQIVANSEVEYLENKRDQRFISSGGNLRLFESDVIVPKGELLTLYGQMYKVFTPFKKSWLTFIRTHGINFSATPDFIKDSFDYLETNESLSSAWPLVNEIKQCVLPNFLCSKLACYTKSRNFPAIKGTSGLSPYLAIGALSPKYLLVQLMHKKPDVLTAIETSEFSWLNELIWRDFYRHLVFHSPSLCKNRCFNDKYQQVVWPNNTSYFTAWTQAKTGYPIVDAAMRQLIKTGWMHNRLRMIVASFLSKHLLIDWRWGERFFMQQLIDGDFCANNGGWQWAASTGCDAQPYFRIFNPIRQSQLFDPNGDFIRMYLPELTKVPTKEIHFPHAYLAKNKLNLYWPAIVNHKNAREKALTFYK